MLYTVPYVRVQETRTPRGRATIISLFWWYVAPIWFTLNGGVSLSVVSTNEGRVPPPPMYVLYVRAVLLVYPRAAWCFCVQA